ncbi:MAG: hypothetical protein GY737_04910 [Desulfobacteraceae bacterium]|nr:hypothetical protein [Desulfobacteraceae bacterium]
MKLFIHAGAMPANNKEDNMKYHKYLLTFGLILFVAAICASYQASAAGKAQDVPGPYQESRFFRVYFDSRAAAHGIVKSFNAIESKYEKGYVVVEIMSGEEYARLVDTGLKMEEIANPLEKKMEEIRQAAMIEATGIPGYPCYRTVEETFATAEAIAVDHPGLATWIDEGDSWEKSNGLGGYDMKVLRLTNSAVPGPKPRIFLTAAIHAREYTTAELVTRLAEYLVDSHGDDPEATWLLDHHEIHIMLHANPDGRKKAETGLFWRKNTNQDYCGPTSNNRGADLNRNFQFKWDCCGGSSDYECSSTYHGAYAASEPETDAIQQYVFSQFADQRGPDDNDPAPLDATGLYIDVHSHGRLVLWPWGWTPDPAPNALQLQTLGRKFAYFNDHTPEQSYGLYPTDGTTTSFTYGELGIASYTFELGTEFFEDCSYFESTILPLNMQALLYAMKVARTPYMTPAGPDAVDPAVDFGAAPPGIPPGTPVTLSAVIDDTRYNNSNGTEGTQDIATAEYYADVPPWSEDPLPTGIPMTPSDGFFNSSTESVEAVIDTTGWSDGSHMIFVRGQDADGNWGAVSAVFIHINDAPPDYDPPVPSPMTWATEPHATGPTSIAMTGTTASDPSGVEYFFECTSAGCQDSGWQDSAAYEDTGLEPDTSYSYRVKARDKSPNQNGTDWSPVASATTDSPPPWTELTYDDFESGWGNYRDGGRDCRLYTRGTHAHQGSSAANIQDNSGVSSSFYHTDPIDVDTPGYTRIEVSFWFKAVSMETGEDFWVQYYDGSTWHTVAAYVSGTDFVNGTFYNMTVAIDEASYDFSTDMKIRFRCDASGNRDDVYIDEISVMAGY